MSEVKSLSPARRLADVDLSLKLGKPAYKKQMKTLETELREMQLAYKFAGLRAVVLVEGWDAVGKGGLIRRLASPLDPRGYQVWPIGAPTDVERSEHYLQRFWRRLPEAGVIAIFDRSWYGRVLVERAEGLTPRAVWRRAYGEINAFEKMLTDDGVRLVKLFLQMSPAMQKARLQARMADPLERWKLAPPDIRNLTLRPDYEAAIDEMFERCSPPSAPWFAVPFEDKPYGRIAALRTIVARLAKGLELHPPPLTPELLAEARQAGLSPKARADKARK